MAHWDFGKVFLCFALCILVGLMCSSVEAKKGLTRKDIEKRLLELKGETNEIDHGPNENGDKVISRKDKILRKKHRLGHWNENPTLPKQRGHRKTQQRQNNDLDDIRLQDVGFDLPKSKERVIDQSPKLPKTKKIKKKSKKRNPSKNSLRRDMRKQMRKALKKGFNPEKVFELMGGKERMPKKFFKKFMKKHDKTVGKRRRRKGSKKSVEEKKQIP